MGRIRLQIRTKGAAQGGFTGTVFRVHPSVIPLVLTLKTVKAVEYQSDMN